MPLSAIIVLAYGPRRTTNDAVERAKRLAGADVDVVVVPAVRPASRLLGSLRSPAVHVVDEPGRAGLAAALDRDEDEVVLVVHDDVLLPLVSLDALVDCHARTGSLVVPWCNDRDQPNSMGTLPPARKAQAASERAAAGQLSEAGLPQVRPSCVLGDVGTLRVLLDRRVTVARTVLRPRELDVVAARGAVAAHDSTCLESVAPPQSPDGRPLLVASMIVRDEEEMLPGCLESLDGLVDHVVVCDTGSVDDTVRIAEEHGAEVFSVEWRDDFGWARNQALERCRESWWVLQIDADERASFESAEEVRRLLATDVDDGVGFNLTITNLSGDGRAQSSHQATRLFCPGEGVHFVGALHEMPAGPDGKSLPTASLSDLSITHLGYARQVIAERDKLSRNVDIAARQYEESPENPDVALHLGRSLLSAGRADEAIVPLREAVDHPSANDGFVAYALGVLARALLATGDAEAALEASQRALEHAAADDEAGRAHAQAALHLNLPQQVVDVAEWRRQADSVLPQGSSTVDRAHEMVAVARAHVALDDLTSAALAAEEAAFGGWVEDVEAWEDIVSILTLADPGGALDRLAALGAQDRTGTSVTAVAKVHGPDVGGQFAAVLVSQGAASPQAVKVGLARALVIGDQPALDVLLPHAHLLPVEVAEKFMDAAAAKGRPEAAQQLAQALLATG